jgi:hypothetical protein
MTEEEFTMSVASSLTVAPRIAAADLKAHLEAGHPATILDTRSAKAWAAGELRVRGDCRFEPDRFQVDPAWPKDRLTVAYCT